MRVALQWRKTDFRISGHHCFLEDKDPAQYKEQIEELILFHWNRTYQISFAVLLDLSEWKQKTTEEFMSSSHEKITQEWYEA